VTRAEALKFVVPGSSIAAILSLGFAFLERFYCPALKSPWSYALVGAWIVVPPIWFMWEWSEVLSENASPAVKDDIAHWHELARNVWLALVLILGAVTDVSDVFKG